MYTYTEKNHYIYRLHPVTMTLFTGVVFVLALVFSHPLYLLALLLNVILMIISAGIYQNWKSYMRFSLLIIAIIIIVNALFSTAGTTFLWVGPDMGVLGQIKISREALFYGAGMSIRLLVIISVFCLFTYTVDPDRLVGLIGAAGSKTALLLSMSTRLFPLLISDFKRINDIQHSRGVSVSQGSRWARVQSLLPASSVLLLSSMERSMQMSESMYARAYGSGPRSSYQRVLWRPGDFIVNTASVLAVLIGFWAGLKGWARYSYYPVLDPILINHLKTPVSIFLVLLIPVFLNQGWSKWPLLRSKI